MSDENLISKSARKRQMHELQDIGAALVRLRTDQLARIELPEDLREAVTDCRKMTKHEAIRRQMQLIGRMMRHLDAAPIAAQLAAMHAPSHRQTALFHRAEKWRDELLADAAAADRFALEYPGADPQRLRTPRRRRARGARRPSIRPSATASSSSAINAILQDHARRQP